MAFLLRTQGVGIAAILLGTSVFLSRILGLVRDKVISFYFGTGIEADIYFTSFVLPDLLNYLLAGGYFSITLVPLLSIIFMKDEKEAWRFFSAAVGWAFLSITILTIVAWWKAPFLASIIAPGFSLAHLERLVTFLRIILPAQICFLPGACFIALLFYRKQFTVPALAPLIYNAGIIILGIIFIWLFPEKGMEGFCWGVLVGAFAGNFLLPYLAARAGGLHMPLCFLHPYMKKLLVLALPLMLGQSIAALDEQFIRIFGSMAEEGSISLLSYARRIVHVPVGVIAQAAGLASFPFLASLAAKQAHAEFNTSLHSTVKNAILIALPISCWMVIAGIPIMQLIYQQGSFTEADAVRSGVMLMIMLPSVLFWTLQQILGRAFYAYQNTITPTLMGTLATLISFPLYWYGAHSADGAAGIAWASSFSIIIFTLFLLLAWRHRFGPDAFRGIGRCILQTCLWLVIPGALSCFCCIILTPFFLSTPLLGAAVKIAASGSIFLLAYLLPILRFRPDLAEPLLLLYRRILRKRTA